MHLLQWRLAERWLFFFLIGISLLPIFSIRHMLTFDGPSHLYNATLLGHLIEGGGISGEYMQVNRIPVPNWLSQSILGLGCLLWPSYVAEKVLIGLYIVSLPLSFRYLVYSYLPQGSKALTFTIFPVVYSFVFLMGFYNLSLSFSVMFFTVGYWERNRKSLALGNFIGLAVWASVLYFAHIFSFIFTILIIGSRELWEVLENSGEGLGEKLKALNKRFIGVLLAIMPSVLLAIVYFRNVTVKVADTVGANQLTRKWQMIYRNEVIVTFGIDAAVVLLKIFMVVLTILSVKVIVAKWVVKDKQKGLRLDFWLLCALLAFILFWVVPDNWNAGMMSIRLLTMSLLLIIVWLALQPISNWLLLSISALSLIAHVISVTSGVSKMAAYSIRAGEIENIGKSIPDGKVLAVWNLSTDWLEPHICSYAAVSSEVLMLNNFEAALGWFPVCWKKDVMPNFVVGDTLQTTIPFFWQTNPNGEVRHVDYVLVYNPNNLSVGPHLQNLLSAGYEKYSETTNCTLFRLRYNTLRS